MHTHTRAHACTASTTNHHFTGSPPPTSTVMPSTKASDLDGRADDVRVDVCVDVANRVTRVAGGTHNAPSAHVYEDECGHEPVTTLAAPTMPMRQAPSPRQTVPRSVSGYVPYDASMSNGIVINEALKRLSQFSDRRDSFNKRGSRFARTSKTVRYF